MRIHHLNCATMCPPSALLVNGEGSLFGRARMVCHCLLIEGRDGLILVDTGLGTEDVRDPARLGRGFVAFTRPALDEAETALRQVERLGYSPRDVRHIVPTHLDLDHAGGLGDFPWARVHVYGAELDAATARATLVERERYRPAQWAHKPSWVRHFTGGDRFFGFDCVRDMAGIEPEVLLVPLAGHTRGHCAVAVQGGPKWLLHAGDAYFHHGEMEEPRRCPKGLDVFQSLFEMDRALRRKNQARLRELVRARGDEVDVFSAHDPVELDRFGAATA